MLWMVENALKPKTVDVILVESEFQMATSSLIANVLFGATVQMANIRVTHTIVTLQLTFANLIQPIQIMVPASVSVWAIAVHLVTLIYKHLMGQSMM